MKIKKFILPSVIIVIFCLIYFLIAPFFLHRSSAKKFIKSFEIGLNNLELIAKKEKLDAKEYGAYVAYSYTLAENKMMIYVYDKNSKKFKQGQNDGFIESKKNKGFRLNGIFLNNCVLYLEENFSKSSEVLSLFEDLSSNLK